MSLVAGSRMGSQCKGKEKTGSRNRIGIRCEMLPGHGRSTAVCVPVNSVCARSSFPPQSSSNTSDSSTTTVCHSVQPSSPILSPVNGSLRTQVQGMSILLLIPGHQFTSVIAQGNKSFSPFSNLGDGDSLAKTWKVCTKGTVIPLLIGRSHLSLPQSPPTSNKVSAWRTSPGECGTSRPSW